MDEILSKDIKIAKVESREKLLIFEDTEGTKYKIWYVKKDGTDTVAYGIWKTMGLRPGSVANVSWKEEQKSFTGDGGQVIAYTDRTVIGLRETTGTGISTPGYAGHDEKKKEQDNFGRRLAIHGFINALLSRPGTQIDQITTSTIEQLIELENRIEATLKEINGNDNNDYV